MVKTPGGEQVLRAKRTSGLERCERDNLSELGVGLPIAIRSLQKPSSPFQRRASIEIDGLAGR